MQLCSHAVRWAHTQPESNLQEKSFLSLNCFSDRKFNEWQAGEKGKKKKKSSATRPGQTISLTARPQLGAATVFAHWKLAWQLPDPDNTTGCQNKLWSLEGARWRGRHRSAGGNCMKQYERKSATTSVWYLLVSTRNCFLLHVERMVLLLCFCWNRINSDNLYPFRLVIKRNSNTYSKVGLAQQPRYYDLAA